MKNSRLLIFMIVVVSISCVSKNNEAKETIVSNSFYQVSLDSIQDTLQFTSGIRAILQDKKGNYWFGSHQEGTCKFDGNNYTYFTTKDGLADNQVRRIREDENGNIWFDTGNGVSYYDGNSILSPKPSHITSIQNNQWKLTNKDIWLNGSNDAYVIRVDKNEVQYLQKKDAFLPLTNEHNHITGFSKGPTGKIWISNYNGVIGFDGKNFELIDNAILGYTFEFERLHIRSILEDSKGRLWIGNNGIGVLLHESDSTYNFTAKYNLDNYPSDWREYPSPPGTMKHVFKITEDSNGNIWFGDRDTGAWKFDGKSMKNYTVNADLKSKMIWDIYEDRSGNLLFAMAKGGVYKFNGLTFNRIF